MLQEERRAAVGRDDAVKVLTVRQPHAALLITPGPIKKFETRSRPTKYRGPFAIHAGLTLDPYGPWERFPTGVVLPTGVIIGGATLVDCRPMRPEDEEDACVAYRPELFVWITAKNFSISNPIPLKGKLGLFNVPGLVIP
jgi:hypothetical protein